MERHLLPDEIDQLLERIDERDAGMRDLRAHDRMIAGHRARVGLRGRTRGGAATRAAAEHKCLGHGIAR